MAEMDPRLQGLLEDMYREAQKCVEGIERASRELEVGDEQAVCGELAWLDSIDRLDTLQRLALGHLESKDIKPKVGP